MLLSVIGRETGVTCSTNQMKKKVELLVFSPYSVFLFLQVNSRSLFFLTLAIINVKKSRKYKHPNKRIRCTY